MAELDTLHHAGRGEQRIAQIDKPELTFNPEKIDKILTLDPSDPNYPLTHSWKEDYVSLVGGLRKYGIKYSLATGLLGHPAFTDFDFISDKFLGDEEDIPEEVTRLKASLDYRIVEEKINRGDRKVIRGVEDELREFAQSVASGEGLDATYVQQLVGLFGASRAVDLLYSNIPGFRKIPIDRVNNILADYLGDYLLTKGVFNPDDIKVAIPFLSNPDVKEDLFLNFKENYLHSYNFSRKTKSPLSDDELLDEYFQIWDLLASDIESEDLQDVIAKTKEYYESLREIQKPIHIVDALDIDREFPDINQRINIKELSEKKRILIADEMGLGKSASAILAKETLEVKQALVIAPSNVIATWQKYLSDEEGGYFKQGEAPKVLVIESQEMLENLDTSSYDYILISQERLTDDYTDELTKLDYGMLIVDEVHKLKNLREGHRAANLVRLAEKVEGDDQYLALLSGTPVPNKVEDIAMVLKLLYPQDYKEIDNKTLVRSIINGNLVDLRRRLVPRMQMKLLAESLSMPDLHESIIEITLSPQERQIYEVLLEEDELEAGEKMTLLRQFLLNPNVLDAIPDVSSAKIVALQQKVDSFFQENDKAVLFVNDYMEGIIRGDNNIFNYLDIPPDVEVRIIMGGVSGEERAAIQQEVNGSDKKILLVVNGQTADVGVDFSGAQAVWHYNEPWTKYDKKQQVGRAYRPGLAHDLEAATFIVKDSIEEGMHRYVEMKYRAIEKLLKGIPLKEFEKDALRHAEDQPDDAALEVNREFAQYYMSSWNKMMKIFGYVKELGEKDFRKFLTQYGRDYSECYTDFASRSYYANANRIAGTFIDTFVKERRQSPSDIRILDMASGPEMLKMHIAQPYQERVVSFDLNKHHFDGTEGTNRVQGSFLRLPFQPHSFDYINLAMAWHYPKFVPSKGEYERLELLLQANRALKKDGRLVITNIYSHGIKDIEKFRTIVEKLGFSLVGHYTGDVASGDNYKAHTYTLQKERDIDSSFITTASDTSEVTYDIKAVAEDIGSENFDGLKSTNVRDRIKDSKKIVTNFTIHGTAIPIQFNTRDFSVLQEEKLILDTADLLKLRYGSVKEIPRSEVIENGFVRIKIGEKFRLFKKLEKGPGVVLIN